MFEKPNSLDKKFSNGFMLNKIAALTPDDIQNFRTSLEDTEQYIFDGESEDDQAVIVALNNLSDDEFDQIVQNQKSLMGIHDLNNYLTLMYTITLNPRYQKFSSQTKEKDAAIDYKDLLTIKKIDGLGLVKNQTICFAISENYTVFMTRWSHEHLFRVTGMDPDATLTEGYIAFDDNGNIRDINFKNYRYQPKPAFTGSPEQLAQLKQATTELIKESFTTK